MNNPPNSAARYDLHLHTDRSDGKLTLDALIETCAEHRLDAIAITDHDFVTVPKTHTRTVNGRSITIIAGAEMTGTHEGTEYHLLVYFPEDVPADFLEFCASQTALRLTRITTAMTELNMDKSLLIDEDARLGKRSLTRFNLAKALVASGQHRNLSSAFAGPLNDKRGLVPKLPIPFTQVITKSRAFGGITVWAHPPLPAITAHLDTFVQAGLHGLEAMRPNHNKATRKTLKKAADQHGLVVSGGSDWHGWHSRPGLFYTRPNEIQGLLSLLTP